MSDSNVSKIDLKTAVIIGMNTMIGAGIFSITSLMGSKIGPAGIITYMLAFVAIWFIAQSFARVAYLFPEEGSFYTYASSWGGHNLGLLSAGAYLLGLLTAAGLLCKLIGIYAHVYIPSCSKECLSLITFALLAGLNLLGMKMSKAGQYILIAATLYPVIACTLLCMGQASLSNLTPFMPYGWSSVLEGTKVAVFGLFGFECIASLFGIMEKPEKNVPLALRLSLLAVGLLYLVFIGSILIGIPQTIFEQHPNITIVQALQLLYPNNTTLNFSIGFSILFAIAGTIHAMIWGASALLFAYFKKMKSTIIKESIKHNTLRYNGCVMIASSIVFAALMFVQNMAIFFSIADTFLLFAFITSIIALLFKQSEWKSGQNIITLLAIACAGCIFYIAIQHLVQSISI